MRIEPNSQEHRYAARLEWTGQVGPGPMEYATYGRSFRVRVQGKPELIGSADPVFRGDASKFNPEDLLVISVAGCHMLTYLALCARRGVTVLAYEDKATGTLEVHTGGGGKFVEITLHPVVTISEDSDEALARELHHPAHEGCFIANSCSVPIRYEPTPRVYKDTPSDWSKRPMRRSEEHRPDLVGDGYDLEPLYNAEEVAAILGVPAKSVYELPVPRVRIGKRRIRWRPADVREFIQRRVEDP